MSAKWFFFTRCVGVCVCVCVFYMNMNVLLLNIKNFLSNIMKTQRQKEVCRVVLYMTKYEEIMMMMLLMNNEFETLNGEWKIL